jgi:hypothetical protein
VERGERENLVNIPSSPHFRDSSCFPFPTCRAENRRRGKNRIHLTTQLRSLFSLEIHDDCSVEAAGVHLEPGLLFHFLSSD